MSNNKETLERATKGTFARVQKYNNKELLFLAECLRNAMIKGVK